jgi:hypothetical protein
MNNLLINSVDRVLKPTDNPVLNGVYRFFATSTLVALLQGCGGADELRSSTKFEAESNAIDTPCTFIDNESGAEVSGSIQVGAIHTVTDAGISTTPIDFCMEAIEE